MSPPLLAEYDRLVPSLLALESAARAEIGRTLEELDGQLHGVASRVKDRASLAAKLARPDRTYQSLTDVTDLVGIRVITYFEDSVRTAAERIEGSRLRVDLGRSVDKRRQVELDRFGYRSLHYICALPDDLILANGLPNGLRFEIQLRTILQHAWAEMEHDLGYKAAGALPARVRRKLSRLAGLLELADEEFLNVKTTLQDYEYEVARGLERGPGELRLDRVSLLALLDDPVVETADTLLASLLGHQRAGDVFFPDYLVEMLHFVGLDDVASVRRACAAATPKLGEFVPRYFEFSERAWELSRADVSPVLRGYSLLFVALLELLDSSRLEVELVEEVTRFFVVIDKTEDRDRARKLAVDLIETTRLSPSDRSPDELF